VIFDPDHGFGGDGTPDEPLSVSNGTCLPNGRFADYYVLYVNSDYAPHCLSRKFGETFFGLDGSQSPYRPEAIQDLLESSSYEEFDNRVRQLHDDLHDGIGGDFQFNTSPYGMTIDISPYLFQLLHPSS
jgi:tyrosinase